MDALGLGLHQATVACNVHMASLLGFLLQLEPLPDHWPQTEAMVYRRFSPGPGNWISPKDMHHLSLMLGMPHDSGNMKSVSLVARFRVAHREAADAGALHVRRRVRELI